VVPATGFEPATIGLKVDFRNVHRVSLSAAEVRREYDRQRLLSTVIRRVSQKFVPYAALLAAVASFVLSPRASAGEGREPRR
jgi:hypothetical protein